MVPRNYFSLAAVIAFTPSLRLSEQWPSAVVSSRVLRTRSFANHLPSPSPVFLQDPSSTPNAFTLFYVKFRAAAPKVRVSLVT